MRGFTDSKDQGCLGGLGLEQVTRQSMERGEQVRRKPENTDWAWVERELA